MLLMLHTSSRVYAQAPITNLYPQAVQREVDLVQSVFVATNAMYDQKLCASLQLHTTNNIEISYAQISFIFYYPDIKDVAPSSSEMVIPNQLIIKDGNIKRIDTYTNEIPLNYIRVFDSSITMVKAELEVLVGVAPASNPRNRRFYHRSFQFIYNHNWRQANDVTDISNEAKPANGKQPGKGKEVKQ
jgi:hypothetical protein